MQPDRFTEHARRIAAMRREMDERSGTTWWTGRTYSKEGTDSYVGSC